MRLSPLDLQWVLNAEFLPLAAVTLVTGALGDQFGQKRIFLAGIALYGLAEYGDNAMLPRPSSPRRRWSALRSVHGHANLDPVRDHSGRAPADAGGGPSLHSLASADYGRLAAHRHALSPVRPALAIVRRRRCSRLGIRHDAPRIRVERDLLGCTSPSPILLLPLVMSLAIAPLTTLVLTSVESDRAGTASGVNARSHAPVPLRHRPAWRRPSAGRSPAVLGIPHGDGCGGRCVPAMLAVFVIGPGPMSTSSPRLTRSVSSISVPGRPGGNNEERRPTYRGESP